MAKRFLAFTVVILMVFLTLCGTVSEAAPVTARLTVGTATLGTIYDAVLNGFVAIVNAANPNLRLSALNTQGSEENIFLLKSREIDLAACNQGAVMDSIYGRGVFDEQVEMYHLFVTHANNQFLMTRKGTGITKIEDLEGKTVSVGAPGTGTAFNTRFVMELGYGLWDHNVNILYLSFSDGVDALRDGTVDAISAYTSGATAPGFMTEADATIDDLLYLPVSDQAIINMQKELPYVKGENSNAHNVLTKLEGDLNTMTTYGCVIVRPDVPADVIYEVMKAFFENLETLPSYHALGAEISPETALGAVIPGYRVHPGAARYYKEVGVWKDHYEIGD